MRYDALTRAIYLQYRSLFDRTPAAVLALVLVGLTAIALALEARVALARPARTATRPARRGSAQPVALGRWRVPALAWCGLVDRPLPRRSPPSCSATGSRRASSTTGTLALPLARGWSISLGASSARRRRATVAAASRSRFSPIRFPSRALPCARAALLRGQRPPRARDRALARVLRRALRRRRSTRRSHCSCSPTWCASSRSRSRASSPRSSA